RPHRRGRRQAGRGAAGRGKSAGGDDGGGGEDGGGARARGRRGGAVAGLLVVRHVRQLRASRAGIQSRGGGAVSEATQIEEATRSLKEPIAEPVPEVASYHVGPVLLAVVLSL